MAYEYMVQAKVAELREEAISANINKVLQELYEDPRKEEKLHLDPQLYARYVWYGLHA